MMRTTIFLFLLVISTIVFGQIPKVLPDNKQQIISIEPQFLLQKVRENASKGNVLFYDLPVFNGKSVRFLLQKNNVWTQEGNETIEIFTYYLLDEKTKTRKGTLTFSEVGIYANFTYENEMHFIFPTYISNNHSLVVGEINLPQGHSSTCGLSHEDNNSGINNRFNPSNRNNSSLLFDGQIRSYRVAIACTGEYYVANGNNNTAVTTSIVSTLNSISEIFENDLAITLTTNQSRIRLYTDPNTDVFTPDMLPGADNRPTQAGKAINANFAIGDYDIGHVFHIHADGDNWGNGGIAQLRSVCNNSIFDNSVAKARGWSGAYTNSGFGWIQLATHEFGHQFGANHTFNGTGGSCTDAISEQNSVEIGSGTTIMSYEGICDASQNIPNFGVNNDYFHIWSINEVKDFILLGSGGTCAQTSPINNDLPAIIIETPCDNSITIPKSTPFYLDLKAEDNVNNGLTYCWEQVDEDGVGKPTQGFIGVAAGNDTRTPLFRSFKPSSNSKRIFPTMDVLLANSSDPFQVLPRVARTINMSLSVRDNVANGGNVAEQSVVINVSAFGPLVVNRPAGGEVFNAGNSESITWITNGSDALCNKVRIKLSTDGGMNFNIVVAENIDYASGSFNFVIPATFVGSTTCRLMVECMDASCFSFFDISNSNFTINSSCNPQATIICDTDSLHFDQGDPGLNLSIVRFAGTVMNSVSRTVRENISPLGRVAIAGVGGVGCEDISNYFYERTSFYVTEDGQYRFDIPGDGFISIFESNFSPANPCPSFIGSSARSSGDGGIFSRSFITVNLEACKDYVLVFYSFDDLPSLVNVTSITGPGIVFSKNLNPIVGFTNLFMLVNRDNNQIVAISPTPDYRLTSAGNYLVYSILATATTNFNDYIGSTIEEFKNEVCANVSLNNKPLSIDSDCIIDNVSNLVTSNCMLPSTTYSQSFLLEYTGAPTTGQISVNNVLFNISSSPQQITLSNLLADGLPVDLNVFFTDNPICALTLQNAWVAPANCCPVTLTLPSSATGCAGEEVTLQAGTGANQYNWFRNGTLIPGQNTSSLQVVSPGIYVVEGIDISSCKKTDTCVVTFLDIPIVNLPPVANICEGDNLLLTVTGGFFDSLQWFRDGVPLIGENNGTLDITIGGLYSIEGINGNICKDTASVNVGIVVPPVIELGSDIEICDGEDIQLSAGGNANDYEWYLDGELIPGESNSVLIPSQSGTYRVIAFNDQFCSSEDNVNLRFFAKPIISALDDTLFLCTNETINLLAQVDDYQSLQWYRNGTSLPGEIDLDLSVTIGGTYVLEAVNIIMCRSTHSVEIRDIPNPVVNLPPIITLCSGSSASLNAGTEGSIYQWKLNGVILPQNSSTISINQEGLYTVIVTNDFGCTTFDTSQVSLNPNASISLNTIDTSYCQGQMVELIASLSSTNVNIGWFQDGILISGQTSPILNVGQPGQYTVEVFYNEFGCKATQSVRVVEKPIPGVNLGGDNITRCANEPKVVLDAGPDHTSYEWTLNNTVINTSQVLVAENSGLYIVVVTNEEGCSNGDFIQVDYLAVPTLEVASEYPLCNGQSIQVNANSNGQVFVWKNGGEIINGAMGSNITINTPGTYSVEVSSSNGCSSTKSFTVLDRPAPTVSLPNDITICPKDTINVLAQSGNGNTYLWSDGATTNQIQVVGAQSELTMVSNFVVTTTNSFGCKDADTIQITTLPLLVASILTESNSICQGDEVILTGLPNETIMWTQKSNNQTFNSSVIRVVLDTTDTFTFEVANDMCPNATAIAMITISVKSGDGISAGIDTCMTEGKNIKLLASGGIDYQWNNESLIIGSSTIANPEISITNDTTFIVTITDIDGCQFEDEVAVCFREDFSKGILAINLLTPNGDGKNDFLEFKGLENFPNNKIAIYNRWGTLLFDAIDYQIIGELFDGFRNGEKLPPDTYYYILTFGDRTIKSSLTILYNE